MRVALACSARLGREARLLKVISKSALACMVGKDKAEVFYVLERSRK